MINLTELRHTLHQFPELSGFEKHTSRLLHDLLKKLNPDQLFTFIGSTSLIAVFDSFKPGNTVIFRADMDALPILETTNLPYKSQNLNVSHKCGHDGHTTILYGLAEFIALNRPASGKAILLWQAAEETGEGAQSLITDLEPFKPDFCFALHNLPGFVTNAIVVREGTFASASEGMIIDLIGLQSHASEPEKGNNPANALAHLMLEVSKFTTLLSSRGEEDKFLLSSRDEENKFLLSSRDEENKFLLSNRYEEDKFLSEFIHNDNSEQYALITIVHAKLGEPALGISPANAQLMLTLRGSSNQIVEQLKARISLMVDGIASNQGLVYRVSYSDSFPATINDPQAVKIITEAAEETSLDLIQLDKMFRWSEDFAHYGSITKSALFGIGAGINHLPLHNHNYDFNDEIIQTGIEMWKSIYKKLC